MSLAGRNVLVTGAAGFLGRHLVAALAARGAQIRTLDRVAFAAPGVSQAVTGDLANPAVCARAVAGIDTVFHAASVLALHDHAPKRVVDDVWRANVEGTRCLLAAAQDAGVRRFVYTSSNHVCLGHAPIHGGDEAMAYAEDASDLYTKTKIAAERLVLAAHAPADPRGMHTCALRPGGLYGPGDGRFIPRVIATSKLLGRHFIWGSPSALVDLTYIGNLVDANLCAAERLASAPADGPEAGGAYFVSDGEPMALGDFNRILLGALGRDLPVVHIPPTQITKVIDLWERLWERFGHLRWPAPPIAICEIKTVALAHWFHIDKAARELGFVPRWSATQAIRLTAEAFRGQLAA